VQHGSALGGIDQLAGEHRVAPCRHAALVCEFDQQLAREQVPAVLRQIGKHLGRLQRQRCEAPGIARERIAQVEVAAVRLVVTLQRAPGDRAIAAAHGVSGVGQATASLIRGAPRSASPA